MDQNVHFFQSCPNEIAQANLNPNLNPARSRNRYLISFCYSCSVLPRFDTRVRIVFEHNGGQAACRIYFASEFDTLRRNYGVDSSFLKSLENCNRWEASGGKSGSVFYKSSDNRFVLKHLTKTELEHFIRIGPHYFAYMNKTIFEKVCARCQLYSISNQLRPHYCRFCYYRSMLSFVVDARDSVKTERRL